MSYIFLNHKTNLFINNKKMFKIFDPKIRYKKKFLVIESRTTWIPFEVLSRNKNTVFFKFLMVFSKLFNIDLTFKQFMCFKTVHLLSNV